MNSIFKATGVAPDHFVPRLIALLTQWHSGSILQHPLWLDACSAKKVPLDPPLPQRCKWNQCPHSAVVAPPGSDQTTRAMPPLSGFIPRGECKSGLGCDVDQNTPAQLLTVCRDTNGFIGSAGHKVSSWDILSCCNWLISSWSNKSLTN